MHIFLKSAVVITDIVEAALRSDNTDFVIRMFKQIRALINPIIVQIFKRRHVGYGLKHTANMSFT